MNDYPPNPVSPGSSFDTLPDNWKEFLQENHDKLTIDQLAAAASYLQDRRFEFQQSLGKSITIEDFEKVKKIDADGDNEEGEK